LNHGKKELLDNDMKIAVFEDDRKFSKCLERIIRQYTHNPTAINTANTGELSLWIKKTTEPILYFLDIMIENRAFGFEIAQQIYKQNSGSLIVFLTAYPKKIINNAFYKIKAFSIIYKNNPELEDEIEQTIDMAEQKFLGRCLYIFVDRFQTLYIPHESICFVETIKKANKLCVHCIDGQYVVRETLKVLQENLAPFGFVRCHKSFLVNKANIRKVDKSAMSLIFHNGVSCPYSYLMKGNLGDLT